MAKLFPTVSWAKGANIYEVNIRQYTAEGTFNAFRQHLPRLQEMGVEILWLMPITPISIEKRQGTLGSYYACSSYTQVNPEFGFLEDLKALIADAHSRGMKIIIDWVANHTGWDHHWKTEHPDWYEKNDKGEFYDENGWMDVIDLNYSNTAMRQEMIRCMQYWISECDIDGFRCDMAHLVPLDFWVNARSACDELKPLFWLAETDDNKYHDVFDTTYAWSWMHKSEQFFRGHCPFHEFKHEITRLAELPDDCYKLLFTTNHDENSWNGTEYEKYGDAAKALAVHSCTWPGIPLIYSGQELPVTKRLKFFDKDVIEWKKHCELHDFYRTLLHLQQNNPALHNNSELFQLHTNCDANVLAYLRKRDEQEVIVFLNLSEHNVRFDVLDKWVEGKFREAFLHSENDFGVNRSFEMKAWEWRVWVRE